ncbi:hypothetical protein PHMEG_00014465 [Phytophthora megakarya]|uniref:Uncharacterized protein n=1 Tax=Phytophthora megakarya TaxID=4795 RepID=A0A225W491_9STRA|nr:hypothetical protein PHMEG_00014465 [Phytophthora megakarya]
MLVETLHIVYNSLPCRLGEYEESLFIRELVVKDAMQATIYAKEITHTIAELYASTKRQFERLYKRIELQVKSIVLRTRHFDPQYGERSGGIRELFERWIADNFSCFWAFTVGFLWATSNVVLDG